MPKTGSLIFDEKTVGDRLKQLKKSNYLTTKDVVKKANAIARNKGIDLVFIESTANNHFSGKSIPNADYLFIYAKVFDVSVDYILTGKDCTCCDTVDYENLTVKEIFGALKLLLITFSDHIEINGKEGTIKINDKYIQSFLEQYNYLCQSKDLFQDSLPSLIDALVNDIPPNFYLEKDEIGASIKNLFDEDFFDEDEE